MSPRRLFNFIWGTLFRLFPCPTRVGLRRIGKPGRSSPVLVTGNFSLTVRRLLRQLRGVDAWLLVADSKGVNVWCAAGGNELTAASVASAVKTTGIELDVDHRTLILPPLSAPGIRVKDLKEKTGWKVTWGPVRFRDVPRFLAEGQTRSEEMKRVTYTAKERLDTALGSLFPFYFLGAIAFLLFGRGFFLDYLVIGAGAFLVFFLACPWIPGKNGPRKVLFLEAILGGVLLAGELAGSGNTGALRADLIIAMVMTAIYGTELGGLAPTLPSEFDPFLARMGIGAIGNVALAGTVRTQILNGERVLSYDRSLCIGCRECSEVCPLGVWEFDESRKKAVFARKELCTACRACLVQCQSGAVSAPEKSK